MKKTLLITLAVLAGVFLLIQLVPYGWSHSNPPVVADAPWPNARAEAIARTSCYDCHSNETDWPVYSYVAPMSWLVRKDVDEARDKLNFSEWDEEQAHEAEEAGEEVEEGNMPLPNYLRIHRDARLTDEEERVLIDALDQMSGEGD